MSTYVFVKEKLHGQHLDALARGGAQAVELFAARQHFDYSDREHVRAIGAWFQSHEVKLHSVHAPLYSGFDWGRDGSAPLNVIAREKPHRIASMDEIKRAIEIAEKLPFRFLIQHLGVPNESFDPRKFDDAMTAVEHLRAFAKPLGVGILVENIPNEISSPEKLAELIKTAHFSDVGVCFDFGHAHLEEGVAKSFQMLKPLIRSTHVHDNKRDKDTHLWPGEGSINWNEAMDLLREAPHAPPLLLEIEGQEGRDTAKESSAAFDRLEKASTAVGR